MRLLYCAELLNFGGCGHAQAGADRAIDRNNAPVIPKRLSLSRLAARQELQSFSAAVRARARRLPGQARRDESSRDGLARDK